MLVKKFFDYLYESNVEDFKIGEEVECRGQQDSILFRGEIGTVLKKVDGYYGIKFDERFNNNLHNLDGADPTSSSYYIVPKYLTLRDKTKDGFIKLSMTHDLLSIMKKIENSKVSQLFLDLNSRVIEKENLKKDFVNFLSFENDGTISFLKQKYWQSENIWNSKRRDSMKANRVLKLILTDEYLENNIKPSDVEIFSNKLSIIFKPMEVLELRGEDMLRAFNYTREIDMKRFSNSCANFHQKEGDGSHSEPRKEWYDVYTKNPNNMAVIVAFKNNKIVGRKTIQQGPISRGKNEGKIYTYVGNFYGEGGWGGKECSAIDNYINKKYPFNSNTESNGEFPIIKIENTRFPYYPPFDNMFVNVDTNEMSLRPPKEMGWKSCYKAIFSKFAN